MKIAVGSDHGGFNLKKTIIEYLEENNIEYRDFGCYSEKPVDYPDFARLVAKAVSRGEFDSGILICGTGIGISIAANKVKGVRAALCNDCFSARMAREHNDANILALGERVIGKGLALEITKTWLESKFQGGRHQRRIDKIMQLEKEG